MQIILIVLTLVFFSFAFVVLFGAPYLPTLKPQIETALRISELKAGDTLVELGSGDGRVILAAAKKGINVVGYEINPILFVYSWIITRRYRNKVTLRFKNFWNDPLPECDVIFTFLLDKYMKKLDKKIVRECKSSVRLVSFAFEIPGRQLCVTKNGIFLYQYTK